MTPGATDLLAVMQAVVGVFERHGVCYFVTGSFASSVHGEFRATNDLDVVAELDASRLASLIAELSREFVADLDQAARALASGGSFNLIHRVAYLKVYDLRERFSREAP